MKIKTNISSIFIVVSSVTFLLEAYLLVSKTSLHLQFLIAACGEVLKNVSEHVHFNPDGVVSSLVLLVAAAGVSLTLWQLIRFLFAHRKLHQMKFVSRVPYKLQWVMNKHSLKRNSILVKKDGALTAYTIGLLKPRMVVSKSLINNLTKQQPEAVVLHELYHLRIHHILWLLLSRLISSLFFFIPLIEYLAQQLKTEFELAANAFVVEKQKTKRHLCDSLALNLQYAGGVIPHFATSLIETRVESLVGNNVSFNRISIRQLAVSGLSLAIMLSVTFVQPTRISANSDLVSGEVCKTDTKCQSTDCSGYENSELHNSTPLVPASFSLSSAY